jgi:hypothetical protein
MLLTTIGKLAYEANDLVESLNAEEDELDRKFLAAASKSGNGGDEGGDAKWYEIEQTDYGPTPMTRKLSYRRAKAMLKKERMKARLDVLNGIGKLVPQNVFNLDLRGAQSQTSDDELNQRIELLQNRKKQLIGGQHEKSMEVQPE